MAGDDKTFTKEQMDAAVERAVSAATGDVDGLKAKVDELIGDNKRLKAELRAKSEVKPEDIHAAEERADRAEAALAEAHKAVKALTVERDKAVKSLETESAFTQRLLIQDGLKSALIANGVKDETFIDALTAKFAGQASVTVEGDARKAMIGDKALEEAIKEFAASDAGKKFVSAPNNSGGGAEGGRKVNADAKTITRSAYDALDPIAKGEAGLQSAKGELKIVDEAA